MCVLFNDTYSVTIRATRLPAQHYHNSMFPQTTLYPKPETYEGMKGGRETRHPFSHPQTPA